MSFKTVKMSEIKGQTTILSRQILFKAKIIELSTLTTVNINFEIASLFCIKNQ